MNRKSAESFAYCADLVRRGDEDRWLSAHYAPPSARARLLALYALHLEIARVPAAVSEPPLGEIRLQWWREALDEIVAGRAVRAHPVVEAAAEAGVVGAQSSAAFDEAIDARARLLYGEPFRAAEELADWLERAEGYLAPCALKLLAPEDGAFAEGAMKAGAAFALARDGARIAPDLSEAAREGAGRLHKVAGAMIAGVSDAGLPALLHFTLTPAYLRADAPSGLARRWRLFSAMLSGRIAGQR